MSVSQPMIVRTADLPIGSSLKFDLIGSAGQVLQRAGEEIDERLPHQLLQLGIESIRLREARTFEPEDSDSVLRSCFPEARLVKIQSSLETARHSLSQVLQTVHESNAAQVENLRVSVCEFIVETQKDVAATLAVVALNSKPTSARIAEYISNHSANLSLLGIAMSVVQQDVPILSYQIGMAGLLHDSWLLTNPDWFESNPETRNEPARKRYRWHPIESADLLNGLPGVPNTVLAMMTEVHEQADGSGYPRGLPLGKVRPGSEILNLADAYLTLTNPFEGTAYVSADAIAYLCFHASKGKFCIETMQLLTKSLSMYPVGSTVELDDASKAIVIRGNRDKPLCPVVRLLHSGYDEIDLRLSHRSIARPWISSMVKAERLEKSRFTEILWKTDR